MSEPVSVFERVGWGWGVRGRGAGQDLWTPSPTLIPYRPVPHTHADPQPAEQWLP